MPLPTLFIAVLLLALPLLGAAAPADDDGTARLERLRQQIHSLRTELSTDKQRKHSLQARLRNMEERLGKVAALLMELKRQIRSSRRELDTLQTRQTALRRDLQHHRIAFAQQIRAAYATGRQEYLKILLNQQDPATVARTLTYYDYYNRARLRQMQSIDTSLSELTVLEERIHHKTQQLEQNRQEQVEEKQQLEDTRSERTRLLAKLNQTILAKDKRLAQMLEDEQSLRRLLDRIAQSPQDIGEGKPFAQLRGNLAWPTRGRLTARFGSPRKIGKLRWQGVMIGTREGSEVRAISHGRVAFSDWLRGFGLLTIIDHGDGYMSLYGGNQSLYKEVGDWVTAGDVIASVGNSGGREQHALYFEIRHDGKPVNPLKWCRGRPKS